MTVPDKSTDWHRASAVADYPGFTSYLEMKGERTRFIIDAQIESASEVPKLQQFIACMAAILALPSYRRRHQAEEDDLQFPDEGINA